MKSNLQINRQNKNDIINIPHFKRDHSLASCFIPIILVGSDSVLDKESKLYIRLLVRLVDKSFQEYKSAAEYIEIELKTRNKLENRFNIINHLENCLNAVHRIIGILDIMVDGKTVKKEINRKKLKKIIKKDINILEFVSQKTIEKLQVYKISSVRNRVEHINEDIYYDTFKGGLFLDVDDSYQKICINNQCISFVNLVRIIKDYHHFMLEVFKNLPNRFENGVYYYDKK